MLKRKEINKYNFGTTEEWEKEYLETNGKRIEDTLSMLEFEGNERVLELGCDSGLFSVLLKNYFPSISHIAIEVDRDRLLKAQERGIDCRKVNLENDKLPFPDNDFDNIFFTEVIEHLQNPLNSLAEVKRVLKPGGILYLSTPNAVGLYARYAHLRGMLYPKI